MKKMVLFLLALLVGCSSNTNKSEEKEELDYSIVSTPIEWKDIFIQEEESYYVYFYSSTCSHCKMIKQDILSYFLLDKDVIYFICTDEQGVFGKKTDITGIDNIKDFYIFGTPFMIWIKFAKVYKYYAGVNAIIELINTKTNSI